MSFFFMMMGLITARALPVESGQSGAVCKTTLATSAPRVPVRISFDPAVSRDLVRAGYSEAAFAEALQKNTIEFAALRHKTLTDKVIMYAKQATPKLAVFRLVLTSLGQADYVVREIEPLTSVSAAEAARLDVPLDAGAWRFVLAIRPYLAMRRAGFTIDQLVRAYGNPRTELMKNRRFGGEWFLGDAGDRVFLKIVREFDGDSEVPYVTYVDDAPPDLQRKVDYATLSIQGGALDGREVRLSARTREWMETDRDVGLDEIRDGLAACEGLVQNEIEPRPEKGRYVRYDFVARLTGERFLKIGLAEDPDGTLTFLTSNWMQKSGYELYRDRLNQARRP